MNGRVTGLMRCEISSSFLLLRSPFFEVVLASLINLPSFFYFLSFLLTMIEDTLKQNKEIEKKKQKKKKKRSVSLFSFLACLFSHFYFLSFLFPFSIIKTKYSKI